MGDLGRLTLLNEIFTEQERERARRYHRPRYAVRVAELALGIAVPAALAFGQVGRLASGAWWAEAAFLSALVVLVGTLARLPLSVWRFRHERSWGFSTQSVSGWLGDKAKGTGIGILLTSGAMLGLVSLARAYPDWWPVLAGLGAAGLVALLTFVAPIVLEPIFNRFRPLEDEELADELRRLSVRAGVPVRDVLVADASRRTRKHNAYVSGLGRTRRVVLWDTLLERGRRAELGLVVAHELGHRRLRHVAWGTLVAMAGAAASVLALWLVLRWDGLHEALGVSGAGDPEIVPFAIAFVTTLDLAGVPFWTAMSRRFERSADRFSLELTRDPAAYEAVHHGLAIANLGDLDPPRLYYLALHGHPTAPERIAAGRAWKGARQEPDR
jgi:STE24 endopeptidase